MINYSCENRPDVVVYQMIPMILIKFSIQNSEQVTSQSNDNFPSLSVHTEEGTKVNAPA